MDTNNNNDHFVGLRERMLRYAQLCEPTAVWREKGRGVDSVVYAGADDW
jgi:hypothetical protein